MKKETGIAVFLGIVAGISIAIFVIMTTRGTGSSSSSLIQNATTPTIAPISQGASPLVISQPVDESVTTASKVTVKGSAQQGSLIVIQSPAGEQVLKDSSGNFSASLTLSPGENTIKVTSYSAKNIDSRSVVIYMLKD